MSSVTAEEKQIIDLKGEGLMGAIALIMEVMWQGNLTTAELVQFCRVTPNGEKLWAHFKSYRNRANERGQREYSYVDFARGVLKENPVPQELKDAAAALVAQD